MTLKRFIKYARDIWLILSIALIMLVAIEIGLSLVFYIKGFSRTPYIDGRYKADAYPDTSWVVPYYQELEKSGDLRWKSYVYWRRKPYHGEFININSDGIRKTINTATSEFANSAVKVFMFGGSTMWGVGSRDSFTIPSVFAREAKNKWINCEVVNFGEFGYVSTQEVTQLMLQLQK